MHSDDYLVLEDESGRVKLRGTLLLPSVYVTGLQLAAYDLQSRQSHNVLHVAQSILFRLLCGRLYPIDIGCEKKMKKFKK